MSIVPQFSTQSDTDPTEMETSEEETRIKMLSENDTEKTGSPLTDKKVKDLNNARMKDEATTGDMVDYVTSEREDGSTSKFYYSLESNMKHSLSETSSLSSEKQADDIPDFITAVQMTPSDAGLPLQLFTKVNKLLYQTG